jgi:hypothetical protein
MGSGDHMERPLQAYRCEETISLERASQYEFIKYNIFSELQCLTLVQPGNLRQIPI